MSGVQSVSSRYLRYWWVRKSQIDPLTHSGKYYHVFYDRWRRYVAVDTYDNAHVLTGKDEFVWKIFRLECSISYTPNGELQFSTVWRYTWYGRATQGERHYPDGTIAIIEME